MNNCCNICCVLLVLVFLYWLVGFFSRTFGGFLWGELKVELVDGAGGVLEIMMDIWETGIKKRVGKRQE